jgi:hypothetical protein
MNLSNIKLFRIIFIFAQILFQTGFSVYGYLRNNETQTYINKINTICPEELFDNEAGRFGLYLNVSDIHIKKSIENNYFSHCGAWCLFDYRNPTQGWFWDRDQRYWKYHDNLYKLCPSEEFDMIIKKFISTCKN